MEDPQPLPEAWREELRRGLLSLRAGEFERAESHFSCAHRWAPHRPEVCFALGRERMRRGEYTAAEELLRVAWQGDTSLVSAAATLARCLCLHLDRREEAHEILDAATEANGPLAVVDVVRSEIFIDQNDLVNARLAAETAIVRCDDAEEETSASASARDAARAALSRVENQEGIDAAELGNYDHALFQFKRAANLDPAWSSPHVNMGAAFVSLGKPRRARVCYEHAVDVDPYNGVAHFNLGLLLRSANEVAPARAALENAVDLDPDLTDARTALAELCLETGDTDRAVVLLSVAVELDPEDSDVWSSLGTALAANDDRGGAEACWRQCIDIAPNHVNAHERLADLLTREGRYLEAAVLAQRALELNSPNDDLDATPES